MGILSKIFTWWDGATIGTALFSGLNGKHVGTDAQGNRYYRSNKKTVGGLEQRWVIYNGANDASRVPAEWHGWLHHSYDELPESHLAPPRIWEADYTPMPPAPFPPIARRARWNVAACAPAPRAIMKPGRRKGPRRSEPFRCPARGSAAAGRRRDRLFGRRACPGTGADRSSA